MTDTDADLVFFPWVRRGASAALLSPGTNWPDMTATTTVTASVEINGRAAPMPVTVMGPAHVTGLDGRQVVRTDPAPGAVAFESNYFPLVEFDEPALPWLFTPAGADAGGHLRPWLCLVVVRQRDGVSLDLPQAGGQAVLRIGGPAKPGDELPDLDTSWAWAHGQLTAKATDNLEMILASSPERSVSRLVCPRVLSPDCAYLACVVPTFEVGRLAALGRELPPEGQQHLAPAWTLTQPSVELPVYYSWRFTTGAGGDFQSLALLLRARPLPNGIGEISVDVGHSGLTSSVLLDTTLPLRGALQPVGSTRRGWADPTLQTAWKQKLALVLNAPATVTVQNSPLLAPPLYGGSQAGRDVVDPSRAGEWFEEVNLSPVNRAIAHLGTRVVQARQDELMGSAWDQAAELRRINQLLRQLQLAERIATSLHDRYIGRMEPATGLQVLAPAQARMARLSPELAEKLTDTGLAPEVFSTTLRRVARPRGSLNRRLRRVSPTPITPSRAVLTQLQPVRFLARTTARGRDTGPVTLERVVQLLEGDPVARRFFVERDVTWGEATEAAITAMPKRPLFAFMAMGERVPVSAGAVDSAAASQFRELAAEQLKWFNPTRVISAHPLPDGALETVFAEMKAQTDPRVTFGAAARARFTIADPGRHDDAALDQVRLSPRFPQPMIEPLTEVAQQLVLPGLDLIPPNTVVPLETNTTFVESYMVGLNTEMGRELLWREYPADLRATYFDRFWDASSSPGRLPDIAAISGWGDRALGAAASQEDFVLLLRSELLRRYPDAIVYAVKGAEEKPPIFTGSFAPDVRYFGFDIDAATIGAWNIVLQEHPAAPRFGIEVGTDTGGATHLTPVDADAALTAKAMRQLPVKITIPATVLMRPA